MPSSVSFLPGELVMAAGLKRQLCEDRFLLKAPKASTLRFFRLPEWQGIICQHLYTSFQMGIISILFMGWYSLYLHICVTCSLISLYYRAVGYFTHELVSVPLTKRGWRWPHHQTTGCTGRTSPQSEHAQLTPAWGQIQTHNIKLINMTVN